MGNPPFRSLVPHRSSSMRRESAPLSSADPSPYRVSPETETAHPRYVLPKDLDAAIKHLDDQQLDRLVSVALEERARRKKPPVADEGQQKRDAEEVSISFATGKVERYSGGIQSRSYSCADCARIRNIANRCAEGVGW